MTVRGLSLNLSDMAVYYHENDIELTKNEMRSLVCLMKKSLCIREEIIEYLWNNNLYIDENTFYANGNRLRDKRKKMGAENFICTVRGVGIAYDCKGLFIEAKFWWITGSV
jgi:two-component system response regulator protein BraR/BceR